jgi:CO/xanthine dehydrogenase Mo-binding subunit
MGFTGMFAGCSQIPAGAFLSKKAGRPVKVVFQRKDEQFAEMDEGIHNIKVGFKKDGTITAVQADTKIAQCSDVQVYSDTNGRWTFYGWYKNSQYRGTCTTVFLNKHGFGAYRCEQQINSKVKQQVSHTGSRCIGSRRRCYSNCKRWSRRQRYGRDFTIQEGEQNPGH